jgi:effector-binding domain-containing protein
MIKIGDFSKLSLVSVRMLRYYEEMGLFKPVKVDTFTGYRYYSVDQLPRLNRILALRDLGLTIDQVARLLDEGLPPEQLRGMLMIKQLELQQQVTEERARLARVEARLRQIEEENAMPVYEILIKKIEPLTVASLRKTIPQPQDVGMMMQELFTTLDACGIRPSGPPIAIWHDTEHKETDWDAEVVAQVDQATPANLGKLGESSVQIRCLPAEALMASTIHQGSYEGFQDAYTALMSWIETNGYHLAGPMRETYLRGPSSMPTDPATYLTEIQVPVEKI